MLLHLVLYSNTNDDYIKMYELTRKYYRQFSKDIITYYYAYDNLSEIKESDLYDSNEYLKKIYIKDDIIFLPGKENRIPGILIKTIFAFEYISNRYPNYSHIIRSNISSVIDLNKIKQYISGRSIDYGGCLLNLQWIDPIDSGITTTEFFGTKFIQGTCIILSKNSISKLLNNKKELKLSIIDDLSIGIFFKEHNILPISVGLIMVTKNGEILNRIHMDMLSNQIYLYRNKQENRVNDLKNIKFITEYLMSKMNKNETYIYSLFYK